VDPLLGARALRRRGSYTVEEAELCDRLPHKSARKRRSPIDLIMTEKHNPVAGQIAVRLALLEPDIPQNTGAVLRLAGCFGVPVDLIEPIGFLLDDRRLKRAALDYGPLAALCRHASWTAFAAARDASSRLVLLTTGGSVRLDRFVFAANDTILLGRESAGVPDFVHTAADARVAIPLQAGARSLNVAMAGAIALFEALRQTGMLPQQ
jgi:tRNA (cytidine/uridine-2'-O-)-methyltransferase